MSRSTILLCVTFILSFGQIKSECQPQNCIAGEWTPWSDCSVSCNITPGTRRRERGILLGESCGGTCDVETSQTEACNRDVCCPEDCQLSGWSNWHSCICTNNTEFCDLDGQEVWVCSRSRYLLQEEQCGGYCDHLYSETKCGNLCCRKNCILGTWSWWSPCIGQCEQEGVQFRTLVVKREAECGGDSCESMQKNETRTCTVGCCPKNCVLGQWSEWGKCDATCGIGRQKRTRFVQNAECNGEECSESPDENQFKECSKYVNVDCVVSPWSVWTSCVLDNGQCGVGHKNRTRTVTVAGECYGKACPNLTESTVCYGECCRQDCQVSHWTEWGPCSSDCGAGISERKREIETQPSCNGTSCPKLMDTKECNVSSTVDCQMSDWGPWSACSNNCGTGSAFRSRKLLTPAYCGGQACLDLMLEDTKSCESYEANVDCQVSEWEVWGECVRNCDQGVQTRHRKIKLNPMCQGISCPSLTMDEWQAWEECRKNCDKGIQLRHRDIKINPQCQGIKCPSRLEFRYCHEKCQHDICDPVTAVCGCRTGYKLSSNAYSCYPIQCPPVPRLEYCPSNRNFLHNCRYPSFETCSNSYNTNCTAVCQEDWVLKGPQNYVTCQNDATWSQPGIFCSPANNRPTDIEIDLTKTSIPENTLPGYCIYMATKDDDYDSHVYSLVGVSKRFEVIEHRLCLKVVADYEDPPNKWNETIISTDLDGLSVNKTFQFEILNTNDPPTAVYLTPNSIPENSMIDTKVGCFTGTDDDPNQTLTFILVNSNKDMFASYKENNQTCLKVAMDSDPKCPTEGGAYCLLNRENRKKRIITVMATDDGSPREKAYFDIHILLTDVNDKPSAVSLEFPNIPEGIVAGEDLVAMTTEDEDIGQTYTYKLLSDPSGLFTIDDGNLRASRTFDYETEKFSEFTIEVESVDNGNPSLSVTSSIVFKVRDVNEAPYELQLTSENAPLTFDSNKPKVRENAHAVVIGTVTIKDFDEGDGLTLTLLGNHDSRLELKNSKCSSVADVNTYCTVLLVASASFNYETEPTIPVSIQAEDKNGLKATVNLTLEILNVNDEASDILIDGESVSEMSVEENNLDAVIGELSAVDEDLSDQHTYSVTDLSGLFVLDGNVLKTSPSKTIDYEMQKSYTLTLTAEDSGTPSMSHDKTITIKIINVNEPPYDIKLTNNKIAENSEAGVNVGDLSTQDPDNLVEPTQTFIYKLAGDDTDLFEINGNKLKTKKSQKLCNNQPCTLNFELKKVHSLKVKVADDGSPALTFEKTITVEVTDVNDPPEVDIAGNSIPENSPADTEVGILTVKDEDVGQTISVELTDNIDVFYLKDGRTLMSKKSLDHENQSLYNITIRATDDGTPSSYSDTVITIEVLNINEPPSFTGETTLSVPESSPIATVVGSVTVVDPDNDDVLTLTLVGNRPEFTLSNTQCTAEELFGTKCTGDITTKVELSYADKPQFTVSISAIDQHGSSVVQLYTIDIEDKNDPPQDILVDKKSVSSIKFVENTADIDVAELSALDPDDGQTHIFALTEGSDVFEIQGNVLRVKADVVIDYEKKKEYLISLQVADSGTPPLSYVKHMTVLVEDINEEPTNLSLDNNKVNENSDKDTVIAKLVVEDPDNVVDITQSFDFVLIDSADGRFKIENGQLQVAKSNAECLSKGGSLCKLNYEDTKTHEIQIMVVDNGFPAKSQTFPLTIQVTNQNDPPRNLQLSEYKVEKNAAADTSIGTLTFDDEDADQSHTISLVGDNQGRFSVSSAGVVTKATEEALDTSKVYEIEAKVTDNGSPVKSMQKRFSIMVIGDKVITLTFTSDGGTTVFDPDNPKVQENSELESVIGTLKAEYEDTSQDLVFDVKESNGLEIVKLSDVTCSTENQKKVCIVKVLLADQMNFEIQSQYTLVSQVTTADNSKKTVEMFPLIVIDINEAPTRISYSGGQLSVQENIQGITLGVFDVEDADTNDSHTYELTNNGAEKFILSQNGQLSVSKDADLDYETQPSIDIEVKVTDKGGQSITQQFTVQVTDVNEKPVKVELDSNLVAEMSEPGTAVGGLTAEDPDHGQTFTYSLTDDAGGRFVLDGNQIKVKSMGDNCVTSGDDECLLDFETATSHALVVMVTDSGKPALSNSFTLTVIVEDVNDPPRNLNIKLESLPEDLPVDSKVAVIEAEDQDDQSLTYSITDDTEEMFTVTGNTVTLNKPLDYETKSSYDITIEATDGREEPKTISKIFVLHVVNVNEPPYKIAMDQISGKSLSFKTNQPIIDENMDTDTLIGRLAVFDHDATDTVTFTTTSTKVKLYNQQCITLTQGIRCTADVRSSVSFDFETESSVDLLFYATDKEGLKTSKLMPLTVQDMNDPPTDIKINGSLSVPENTVDFVMATLSAEDTDLTQTHSFTVQSDSKFFYIVHNQLKVTSAADLDYESQKTYEVRVRVTDNGQPALSFDKTLTIDVTDVNEPPTQIKLSANKIAENSVSGAVVGRLITEDPDNNGRQQQTFTYTMTDNAGGRFQISNGQVIVDRANFDYEKKTSYSVSIKAEDSGEPPLSKEVTFNIEITNSNDPPAELMLSANTVTENSALGTVVGSVSATDPDSGQTLSYTLSRGDNLSISGTSVVVSGPIDFEATPTITFEVQVYDNGFPPMSTAKNFTIEVKDKNERPADVVLLNSEIVISGQIPESTLIDDVIGTLVTFDPDSADKMTFTLPETGSSYFKLSPASPECKKSDRAPYLTKCSVDVLLKKVMNYEDSTQRSQRLVVMVTDHLGLTIQQDFTFNVINANEPPYDIILGGDIRSIPENSPGYKIGKLDSLDDDEADEHIYQVITYWELFSVKEGILIAEKPLDYEQKQSYSVTIKSRDNGTPSESFTKTFEFKVENQNEPPSDITVSPNEVSNAAKVGDIVGIVMTFDPDNKGITKDQTHSCSVGGEGVGVFSVDNSNMQLKVSSAIPLDRNQTVIEITCTDSGEPQLATTVNITINIKEIIETPKIIVLKDQKAVTENIESFRVGKIDIVNQLTGKTIEGTFQYEVTDPTVPFTVDGDLLKTSKSLDFETQSDWSVPMTASGNVNGQVVNLETEFKIEVSDVNEAPFNVKIYEGGYIAENSDTGSTIGTFYTEDQEPDQTYTYTILAVAQGLDIANAEEALNNVFVVDDKTLKVGTAKEYLNFETSKLFTILVNSVDSGTPRMAINDTVNVVLKDVNDPPSDITFSQYTVAENSGVGTVVGDVYVTDEDDGQTHSCDIDNSRVLPFEINEDLKLLISRDELDYEGSKTYILEVSCKDLGQDKSQFTFKKAIVVNVTDVNEAPYDIRLTSLEISESSQPGENVGGVKATDPDSTKVTFTVEGSSDFRIEGEDTLVTIGQLDYETQSTYTITIKAVDDGGLSSTKDFVIKVIDENEAPTGIKLDRSEVEENLKPGTVIGKLTTQDPDWGQTFTYTIVPGESDGYFAITEDKLVVGDLTLDFETNQNYKVVIKSTDSGSPAQSKQEEFTITVKDVNEPPENIIFQNVAPLPENTPLRTVITTIEVDDQDAGQSHSCSLPNKATPFAILTNENEEKTLVLHQSLDFETAEKYDLTVQCSDGEFQTEKVISIEVVDVNEAPTVITLSGSKTILADGKPGDLIGHLSGNDPDYNQVLSFVLKGQNSEIFKVEKNMLLLNSSVPKEVLTSENPMLRITIQASDNGDPVKFIQQNFTLLITNVKILAAELPSVTLDNMQIAEDSDIGTIIGTLYNMNQSIGEHIVFDLEQNPDQLFSIKDNKHLVLEKSLGDYVGTSITAVISVKNTESFETASQPVTILIKHVDRCLKDGKTCSDDARCIKLNATYHSCQCEPGFSGDGNACTNIDDCYGNDTCFNGASCIDSINSFSCLCLEDYNGERCELSLKPNNPCQTSPCQNKGACISDDGKSYSCICGPGWKGATCSESIDDCENSTCLAGGLCIDGHMTYICECPLGRLGPRCEYYESSCQADKCTNNVADLCIPLYNSEEHTCAKSEDDLVNLIIEKPLLGELKDKELKARITDKILALLDRKGVSTTTRRRKRRSTNDVPTQVYIYDVINNGDGTISITFVVLNGEAVAFTEEQVIEMLSQSCTEIESGDLTEEDVCPAIKSIILQHTVTAMKPGGGVSHVTTGGGLLFLSLFVLLVL